MGTQKLSASLRFRQRTTIRLNFSTGITGDKSANSSDSWFSRAVKVLDFEESGNWPDRFGSALRSFIQTNNRRINTLSLFSGAGGLDIGFHDAGFDVKEMVEIEKSFASTLKVNAEPGEIFESSIVHAQDVRTFHANPDTKYDFIIGGPPCQTFSAAGRRAAGVKGTSDPRGVLFEQYVRLLGETNPMGFLFENVYGIVGAEGGEPWKLIVDSFEAAGYILSYRILDTADFGTPQHRERLFILGIRSDIYANLEKGFRFPEPSHGPDSRDSRPFNAASASLKGLGNITLAGTAIRGRWGNLLPGIPPGLNYSFYTAKMGHPRPVFAWRSKFSDFLYKADPETPARTVKAQGGAYTGPLSWENRHFSVEEFKRLQTFPDAYELSGNRATQIHQIGNSVPPQIARTLAMSVLDQVFGGTLPFRMDYLDESINLGFRSRKKELSNRYASKAAESIAKLDRQQAFDLVDEISNLNGHYCLGENFEIRNELDLLSVSFTLDASFSDNNLRLSVKSDAPPSVGQFDLALVKLPGTKWPLPFDGLFITGDELTKDTFTGTLKVFEGWMRKLVGVEDLIQLNGYYQNKSALAVSFESDERSTFVSAYARLVKGDLVGEILPESKFEELGVNSEASVDEVMDCLRDFGFEVRNSNTNPQIPRGHYLIPYLFPTLNSRSVQRRKSLR